MDLERVKVLYRRIDSKRFCCYPEISREVTLEAKKTRNWQLFLKPLLFSELLLGRKKQFKRSKWTSWCRFHWQVFDVLWLYAYWGQLPSFDAVCREHIYSKIFILPPWKEIYTSDVMKITNNRQNWYKITLSRLIKGWLYLIEVPKDTVDNRILLY
jgi:predicted ATPase